MRAARVQAQGKINLLLHVGPRDTTGYHDIQTIFQRVDLADDIVVRVGVEGRTLYASGPRMPADGLGPVERNLAYRAAVEFAKRADWPGGFAIELTKNIPVGGGLGGGSADAGGVLRALNALAPRPLSEEGLWGVASALGSDVPFLTKEWITAIGTGHGSQLTNVSNGRTPASPVLIAIPPFSVSTADAYRWLDEDRAESGWDPRSRLDTSITFEPFGTGFRPVHPAGALNEFEPVVERRHPVLREIRERLVERGAFSALLAGSGSCVFGLFRDTPPSDAELGLDVQTLRTQISSRVVQVEVLE